MHHYYRNYEALKSYVCGDLDLCPDNKARETRPVYTSTYTRRRIIRRPNSRPLCACHVDDLPTTYRLAHLLTYLLAYLLSVITTGERPEHVMDAALVSAAHRPALRGRQQPTG